MIIAHHNFGIIYTSNKDTLDEINTALNEHKGSFGGFAPKMALQTDGKLHSIGNKDLNLKIQQILKDNGFAYFR